MDKLLNIEEFVKEVDGENVVFIGEGYQGKKVDMVTMIYEKLCAYENIVPSEYNLKDDADGWKKIAKALASALIVDYGEEKIEDAILAETADKIMDKMGV